MRMRKWISVLLAVMLIGGLTACSSGQNGDGETETTAANVQTTDEVTSEETGEETAAVPETEEVEMEEAETAETSSETAEETVSMELPDGETAAEERTEAAGETGSGTNMLVAYFSYAENAELPEGADASSSASIQSWNGNVTGNTGVIASMIAETTGADLFSIQTVEKYPDTYDATLDQGQEEQSADARPELASHIENLEDYDVIFLGFPNWWGDMPMAMYSFLDETDLTGKTVVPFVTSGGSGFSNTISTIESIESGAEMLEGLSVRDSDATGAQEQVDSWLAELGYAG